MGIWPFLSLLLRLAALLSNPVSPLHPLLSLVLFQEQHILVSQSLCCSAQQHQLQLRPPSLPPTVAVALASVSRGHQLALGRL